MAEGLSGAATALAKRITNEFLAGLLLLVVIVAVIAIAVKGFTIYVAIALAVILFAVLLFRFAFRSGGQPPPTPKEQDTIAWAETLDENTKENIRGFLENAANAAAFELEVPEEHVRANVWGIGRDRRLRLVKELTYNMNRPEELTLSMRVGQGAAGLAFAQKRPMLAPFNEGWGQYVLPTSEAKKLDPALRWVIALPVSAAVDEEPIWIMGVDGLHDARTEGQLGNALQQLLSWGGTLYLIATKGQS